jgi:hypothetical protein
MAVLIPADQEFLAAPRRRLQLLSVLAHLRDVRSRDRATRCDRVIRGFEKHIGLRICTESNIGLCQGEPLRPDQVSRMWMTCCRWLCPVRMRH